MAGSKFLKMASLVCPTQPSSSILPSPRRSSKTSSSRKLAFPNRYFGTASISSRNLGLRKSQRCLVPVAMGVSRFPLLLTNPGGLNKFESSEEERRAVEDKEVGKEVRHHDHNHPYAFHVSGPCNVSSPDWSWKDENYKREAIACFVQAVYLLEEDKQNSGRKAFLSPDWWQAFKYKVIKVLVDERDGSIFGAVFKCKRLADVSSGAPKVLLGLRGTLLTSSTIRRDIEDDLRYVTYESLKGSIRFKTTLEALKLLVERYGSQNVCVAGHSIGAALALQVGKTLALQGIFVETHVFNPPSVSLPMGLRSIGKKLRFVWKRFTAMLPFRVQNYVGYRKEKPLSADKMCVKWVPHLYVNNSDYLCRHYNEPYRKEKTYSSSPSYSQLFAKVFVMSKGDQKFLEAHGLQQWWSDNLELQLARGSKLIKRQLRSLYTLKTAAPAPEKGQTTGESVVDISKFYKFH